MLSVGIKVGGTCSGRSDGVHPGAAHTCPCDLDDLGQIDSALHEIGDGWDALIHVVMPATDGVSTRASRGETSE
jgi:hypothetical protein